MLEEPPVLDDEPDDPPDPEDPPEPEELPEPDEPPDPEDPPDPLEGVDDDTAGVFFGEPLPSLEPDPVLGFASELPPPSPDEPPLLAADPALP